jgi:acetylornithine deacetylase/succinyl-diaminopimelate desuccinylase-like protein
VSHAAIDRDFDDHVAAIREFLRIPSVSAGDGDLRPTAAAVRALIERAGGSVIAEEAGELRPSLIGVIEGPPPTVMRYGMYDVQPPGSGWTRDPFSAELADGRIYARGAANSKAALAAGLLVFASAPSPCRQVFLMEGEEELGSPRLETFVAAHRDELRADWALDFDLAEENDGSAPVVAGCKGLHELELHARDGVDVHSAYVGEVPAPAADLARAIVALQAAVPAANVTWMLAGTPEDESRTVIPGRARAGVDLRFDDDGDGLLARVRGILPAGVELVVKGTYAPATAPIDSPPVLAMASAMRRHGTTPEIAAQAPWWGPYHLFGAPFASGGPGRSGGQHGPDEWCEVEGLRLLMHVLLDTVSELAEAPLP